MHQGQFASLEEVVDFYSDTVSGMTNHGQPDPVLRPIGLTQSEKSDLIAFLQSLNGAKLPETMLRQPRSPLWD